MGSYFQGGSASNYTIGAARFWFSRLYDATTTPVKYEGFFDVGNIVEHSMEQTIDVLDHFSGRTGTRKKDRSLVREFSEDILLTLDELDCENLRAFLRGATISDVAASPAGGTITDEVAKLINYDTVILGSGYAGSTIVVKDITGVTTYSDATDYEVVNIIGGYKGIKRRVGSTILTGDFVRMSYKYDIRAHRKFYPLTVTEVLGQAMFFGVSDTGNEFIRSFRLVQLESEGALSLSADDWSSFQLRMKILDDSETTPTAPFGLFQHYGKGTDI